MSGISTALFVGLVVALLRLLIGPAALPTAVAAGRGWVWLITAALPKPIRDRRRAEARSDLAEHIDDARKGGEPAQAIALRVLGRWLFGVPADCRWLVDNLRAVWTAGWAVLSAEDGSARAAEVQARRGIDRMEGDLLTAVGDGLKAPITLIVGYGELLEKRPIDHDQARWMGGKILAAGRHLGRLVDDLLDAARLESGRFTLEPGLVDLRHVAETAVETARVVGPAAAHGSGASSARQAGSPPDPRVGRPRRSTGGQRPRAARVQDE